MSIRKRKNYFHGHYITKKRNRLNILNNLQDTEKLCHSLGLECENIIFRAVDNNNPRTLTEKDIIIIKQIQKQKVISYNEKTFKAMKSKDLTNQSNEKYKLQRNIMDYCEFPSLKRIKRLQKKINNLFDVKKNNYGVYCDPKKKIEFICKKYLEEHNTIENDTFIIKLSGIKISYIKNYLQLN